MTQIIACKSLTWPKCPDYLAALAMVSKVSVKIEIPLITMNSVI